MFAESRGAAGSRAPSGDRVPRDLLPWRQVGPSMGTKRRLGPMCLDDFGMIVYYSWKIFGWFSGWFLNDIMISDDFRMNWGFLIMFRIEQILQNHDVKHLNGFLKPWSWIGINAWLPRSYLKQAMGHPNGTTINWPFFWMWTMWTTESTGEFDPTLACEFLHG